VVVSDAALLPKVAVGWHTCHTVLAQLESGTPLIRHEEGIPFKHPVDLGDLTQVTCSDCHTGGGGAINFQRGPASFGPEEEQQCVCSLSALC